MQEEHDSRLSEQMEALTKGALVNTELRRKRPFAARDWGGLGGRMAETSDEQELARMLFAATEADQGDYSRHGLPPDVNVNEYLKYAGVDAILGRKAPDPKARMATSHLTGTYRPYETSKPRGVAVPAGEVLAFGPQKDRLRGCTLDRSMRAKPRQDSPNRYIAGKSNPVEFAGPQNSTGHCAYPVYDEEVPPSPKMDPKHLRGTVPQGYQRPPLLSYGVLTGGRDEPQSPSVSSLKEMHPSHYNLFLGGKDTSNFFSKDTPSHLCTTCIGRGTPQPLLDKTHSRAYAWRPGASPQHATRHRRGDDRVHTTMGGCH